jgi:predicted regulator of Ras-like GTPase activity (Roadblock/LC7/MglB family)
MDAAQALADLTEISSQIESVVLFDEGGSVQASTLAGEGAARSFADVAARLLEQAREFRSGGGAVAQLEAATRDGSVFVVRGGTRVIAATTGPTPTVGLVFYDLKSCLRSANGEPEKPRRTRRKKAADET